MQIPQLIIKTGREQALLRRHPWIFSGAVARLAGAAIAGDTVAVRAGDGRFLGWAAYSPASRIVARIWSWREDAPLGPALVQASLREAIGLRHALLPALSALRLVNGESDRLPGVICDRYGDQLVLQLSSAGADRWREQLADGLVELTGLCQIYERSDAEVLALEGLPVRTGVLRGEPPAEPLPVDEHGLRYFVSIGQGHKTGFYLDQRDNRLLVQQHAAGREVLDCFCYTGGFSVNALAGGARFVTAIEASAEALHLAATNAGLNGLASERVDWLAGDAFKLLRRLRDQARQFDLIVLDPPKFAPTAALAGRAARGYKDINLLAFKLLRSGGLLFTFSCSSGVPRDLFQKIVAGAAVDAGVDARILKHLGAGLDHPIALHFPEGEYLKGLLCQVV